MRLKTKQRRGAMLFEVALCFLINIPLLLGGLELGWYLHVRQGLAGAAGQAVHGFTKKESENTVKTYLIGLNFSDSLIEAAVIDVTVINNPPDTTKVNQVTVSLPLSKVLIFGGIPSALSSSSEQSTVSATAYLRELKKNK